MQAIILAAGKGTRLRPMTQHTHKCLTRVLGVPILYNALDNLKGVGVDEVILVVGYLAEQIRGEVGEEWHGMHIRYVHNDNYESTNTSASLLYGIEQLNLQQDCLVLEGDVFFDSQVLMKLLQSKASESAASVLEKYNESLDGTFVELSSESYIVDWLHKTARKENFILADKYKTVNIHYFTAKFIDKILKPELVDSAKIFAGSEAMEFVLQRIVKRYNSLIKGVVLEGERWFEIDDISDLKQAEKIFE